MNDFMKNFSLEGKIAWITGASYGIGFAIATAYAQSGAKIVFNDINQELVDKGMAAYKEAGIDAVGYVCDVTNEEAVQALVKRIEAEVGVVDILVNNAGIIRRVPMTEMPAGWTYWSTTPASSAASPCAKCPPRSSARSSTWTWWPRSSWPKPSSPP